MNPVEVAFIAACGDELAAPKPGNVHRHGDGHGMTVADFELSATAAAPHLCAVDARLGGRIREAARATRTAVGQNTNLGILLLCGPLAMAAQRAGTDLRDRVKAVIDDADIEDTEAVFEAIRIASPGGLGSASRHDVRAPATTIPRVAMAAARDRDSIARQWATGFADIFDTGIAAYVAARSRGLDTIWATLATYLRFIAGLPDSHVVRKHGIEVAESLRHEAQGVADEFERRADPQAMLPQLLAWDARLKMASVNPGTSADLAVTTGFACRLQNVLP